MKKRAQRKKDKYRILIDRALTAYLDNQKGPPLLQKAMKYAVLCGGKRLRPLLTIESAMTLGGDARKSLPFACAIELIHNFSLVHDDLPAMDNDNMRRGKPACHKKYGEGVAILTGDALLNLAFGILARAKHKRSAEIISLVSGAVGAENMIGGQTLDLRGGKQISLRKINRMKTASLMAVSCEIGALAANARRANANRMRRFGENLGLAFQIADDIEDSQYKRNRLEEMKKETAFYIAKGKKNIALFGEKAEGLLRIADSVLEKIEHPMLPHGE